jgi:hypothetical protein
MITDMKIISLFLEELGVPRSFNYMMECIQETDIVQVFCALRISGDINISKEIRT